VRCSARRPAGGGDTRRRVIGRCRTRHGQADAHAEAEGAACQGESGERSPEFHIICPFLVCVARPPDRANLGVCSDRGGRLPGIARIGRLERGTERAEVDVVGGGQTVRWWRDETGGHASLRARRSPPTKSAPALHAARTPSPAHGLMGRLRTFVVAWIESPAVMGAISSRCRSRDWSFRAGGKTWGGDHYWHLALHIGMIGVHLVARR
jgi:hypothetical protein